MNGKLITGDLKDNTMTFELDEPITLRAGEYVILSKEDHKQQIKDAFKYGRYEENKNGFLNGMTAEKYYETLKTK